jgi:hypothetical protein
MLHRSTLVLCLLLLGGAAHSDEVVTIHAGVPQGPMPMTAMGFLHGMDEFGDLDHEAVATLDPAHWRLNKFINYEFVTHHESSLTYILSDSYAWQQGGYPNARPWEDWEGWEQYIREMVAAIHDYFPDNLPAFYDVWNEPDHPFFWTGNYDQLLELFARTINTLREVDPEAKLIGPSIARFLPGDTEVAGILGFLSDLDEQYGVSLDAVSWHENDSANIGGYFPEDIPQHAQIIRNGIEAIFGPDYRPQLHINEYAGSRVHLSPGWNVGYIYYLIESEIDGAMRSCWTVLSGQASELWSDCWDGLNGMFMNDALTPTHAYWVYQHYAKMAGGQRLLTVSTSPRTTVVAARDDGEEVLRTLVGRYWQGGSSDVTVRFASYPYQHASVLVEVGRIPHHAGFFADPPIILPLPDGPVDPTVVTRDVVGGAFDVILQGFRSNEAYLITVTGDEITAAGERLPLTGIDLVLAVPNPFVRSAALRFQLPRTEDVFLAVYDPAGRRVATVLDGQLPAGSHVSVWDGRDDAGRPVASGTYIVRLAAGREVAHSHLVLVK